MTLVNDVNLLLHTPLLPGAAAGTLEPRHVVAPLRVPPPRNAIRPAKLIGENVAAALTGSGELRSFRFKALGVFAELGRQQATSGFTATLRSSVSSVSSATRCGWRRSSPSRSTPANLQPP